MKQFFKTVFASAFGVLIAAGVIILVGVFMIIGLVSSSSESAYKPKDDTIMKIDLKGSFPDQSASNSFSELLGLAEGNSLSLNQMTQAIRRAKRNDKIKGIYIEANGISSGVANLQALRKELADFKESGKFIYAYGDSYSQGDYYVCSIADSVFLNPLGSVALVGLASQGMFFVELSEKIGVKMEIFKVGTYKSAVEPFIEKKFSEANREQINSYMGSIWGSITSAIEESREIQADSLNSYLNNGLAMGEATNAIAYKLADQLCYRFEVENKLKALLGQEAESKLKTASPAKVASIEVKEKEHKDKVALLYAEGTIKEKGSSTIPGMPSDETVINEELAVQIRKLQFDESVKAVVLRVNSPGGSAYISEQIWKAVVDLKAVKPIVISMGNLAASGGYYISCGASKIFAEPTTLTGSIGVYGMFPNFSGILGKIGVTTDIVKTNTYSDLGDDLRPMREDEKALIQKSVESTYALFLKRCAEGRGKTVEEINVIGQGRVWSGEQGVELGLVDELGGIREALKSAAELAELTDYSVMLADAPKDFFTKMMEKKLDEVKLSVIKSVMGEEYTLFRTINRMKNETGILARIPHEMELN